MLPSLDHLAWRAGSFTRSASPSSTSSPPPKDGSITLDPFKGRQRLAHLSRAPTRPRGRWRYKYHYYKASALWQHDSDTPKKDPLTNQPIWYEDWMALHDAYDPFPNAASFIPSWVFDLPTREPGTVKMQPPPPLNPPPRALAPPPPSRAPENAIRVRRMEALEDNEPAMQAPTPIWVHRQPNRPQYQLTDEDRESERLHGVMGQGR